MYNTVYCSYDLVFIVMVIVSKSALQFNIVGDILTINVNLKDLYAIYTTVSSGPLI